MHTLLDIIGTLNKIDHELFLLIHAKLSSPKIDWLFKALRDAITWIPLYAFILYWILRYQKKNAWQFILLTLVLFAITDHVSASIMKPYFQRLRPCFDPSISEHLRLVISCGGKYGMPSTHAANHFGMASFWFFSIGWMSGRKWYWLWLWAFLVGYSQVYVGKHFPGDILVGALLGTTVGLIMALLFRKWRLQK